MTEFSDYSVRVTSECVCTPVGKGYGQDLVVGLRERIRKGIKTLKKDLDRNGRGALMLLRKNIQRKRERVRGKGSESPSEMTLQTKDSKRTLKKLYLEHR